MSIYGQLTRGESNFDIVGRRRLWLIVSLTLLTLSLGGMLIRGFDFGIEFKGGTAFQFPASGITVEQTREVLRTAGVTQSTVQTLGGGDIRIQTGELDENTVRAVADDLSKKLNVARDQVSPSTVGSSWGSQVSRKALQGLVVFLILTVVYLSIRFEPKMALSAVVALLHDVVITAGIYALVGFEVTPATIVALLTILGFSIYDTVVVFDKVRENTRGLTAASRTTFTGAANRALNQTIMRSLNTSIVALLPVAALLFVGAGLLGAGTLKDLALAQFIGIAVGTYSSLFVATPLLCWLKEREPEMVKLAERVARGAAKAAVRPGPQRPVTAAARSRGPATAGRTGTAVLERTDHADGNDAEMRELPDAPAPEPAADPVPARPARPPAGRRPSAQRGGSRSNQRRKRR